MPSDMRSAVAWFRAAGYTESPDGYSWIPGGVMYDRFYADPKNAGVVLSRRVLGMAFHLAFPDAERVTRRVGGGKQCRGWAYMSGPGYRYSRDPGEGHLTSAYLEAMRKRRRGTA